MPRRACPCWRGGFGGLWCSTASAFFAKAPAAGTMADNPPSRTRDMPPGARLGAMPRRACPCWRGGFGGCGARPPRHRAPMPITHHATHGTCLQAHAWARWFWGLWCSTPRPFSQRLRHRVRWLITHHAKHGICLQAHAWARWFWGLWCSTASAFFAKAPAAGTMADNPPSRIRDMPPGARLG